MTRIHRLERAQLVSKPLREVFEFFSSAENLQALTPVFLGFRILTPLPIEMGVGTRIDYSLSLARLPIRWRTHITVWEPGVRFVDEQEKGPYATWRHTHEFAAHGESTRVNDTVEYAEPFGPLGWVAHALFVRRTLDRIFDFRRDQVRRLLDTEESHVS
jgi:ligand-binding SRPBCC domain-containing protein